MNKESFLVCVLKKKVVKMLGEVDDFSKSSNQRLSYLSTLPFISRGLSFLTQDGRSVGLC